MKKKIIIYRYDDTGVFGYEYYRMENEETIGSISSMVLPQESDCQISMNGKNYQSRFDENATLIKGLRRSVLEQETGQVVGYIELSEWNTAYHLIVGDEVVEVEIYPDEMTFVFRDNPVAIIRHNESYTKEDEYGNMISSKYLAFLNVDIANEIEMMILSFVALRF